MDQFNRQWITENAIEEIQNYAAGVLTVRGLHYRLVSRGMFNTIQHYKRVCAAMAVARWDGLVPFETFSDHDREILGETPYKVTNVEEAIEEAKEVIVSWMEYYRKNRWENQSHYVEVFIEKKALLGVFQSICRRERVALGACKGYPSLTFLNDSAERIREAEEAGKHPVILYFGDYDPTGEDIPRSIKENLSRLGCGDLEVRRVLLMENQVTEWDLPPAPVKKGDSRSAKWDGLGQVELDAVEPGTLQEICRDSIKDLFDEDLNSELRSQEVEETEEYKRVIKEFVQNIK